MELSRIVGVLALVAQIGNAAQAYFIGFLPADAALVVAGVLAAIQAFTARVQGKPVK